MWEDLECDGAISSISSGDGTGQWVHILKSIMDNVKDNDSAYFNVGLL
jgi:hypothetical protein